MAIKFNTENTSAIKYNGKDSLGNTVVNADVKYLRVNGQYRWAKPFTLMTSIGVGTSVVLTRLGSYEPSSTVNIQNNIVYYGDTIAIKAALDAGYKDLVLTVTGLTYMYTNSAGRVYEVTGPLVSITVTATRITWTLTLSYGHNGSISSVDAIYYKVNNGAEQSLDDSITLALDYADVVTTRSEIIMHDDFQVLFGGGLSETGIGYSQIGFLTKDLITTFDYQNNANKSYELQPKTTTSALSSKANQYEITTNMPYLERYPAYAGFRLNTDGHLHANGWTGSAANNDNSEYDDVISSNASAHVEYFKTLAGPMNAYDEVLAVVSGPYPLTLLTYYNEYYEFVQI